MESKEVSPRIRLKKLASGSLILITAVKLVSEKTKIKNTAMAPQVLDLNWCVRYKWRAAIGNDMKNVPINADRDCDKTIPITLTLRMTNHKKALAVCLDLNSGGPHNLRKRRIQARNMTAHHTPYTEAGEPNSIRSAPVQYK